jgi:hypothetical protein
MYLAVIAGAVLAACGTDELAELREATSGFQSPEAAVAAGWDLVEGLDNCFDNPGVGGMGIHYINVEMLDGEIDPMLPESFVYMAGPDGELQLGAVEYIVPLDQWSGDQLPSALGQPFHLVEELGVLVLHAWIFEDNPAGTFQDWNPNVSCPAS